MKICPFFCFSAFQINTLKGGRARTAFPSAVSCSAPSGSHPNSRAAGAPLDPTAYGRKPAPKGGLPAGRWGIFPSRWRRAEL